ncbi:hypothetical protein Taro_039391, partial [Colocasia esculenta]|nr:hypothetical protein [Colocasia esculenta]
DSLGRVGWVWVLGTQLVGGGPVHGHSEHSWQEEPKQYQFIEKCLAGTNRQKQPWLIFVAHRMLGYSPNYYGLSVVQDTCMTPKKYHFKGLVNGMIHAVAGGLSKFTLQTSWRLYKDYDFGFMKLTVFNCTNRLLSTR